MKAICWAFAWEKLTMPVVCIACYHSLASGYIFWASPQARMGKVPAGRATGVKIKKYLGLHGWAYSHSHLCGCCRPASGRAMRGVSEKGPAIINQGPHPIQNLASTKEVCVHVLWFFMFLSAVSSRFPLVVDPTGRQGGLRGRLRVLVRNLRTVRAVYWVNVSETSGASSPGLSGIKAHSTVGVVLYQHQVWQWRKLCSHTM